MVSMTAQQALFRMHCRLLQQDEFLERYFICRLISRWTCIRAVYVLYFIFICLLFIVGHTHGITIVYDLITFTYPIKSSLVSMKYPYSKDEREGAQHWLMYWIIFCTVSQLELFYLWQSWIVVIPFYHLYKFIFFLWCAMPQTRGTRIVYMYARFTWDAVQWIFANLFVSDNLNNFYKDDINDYTSTDGYDSTDFYPNAHEYQ